MIDDLMLNLSQRQQHILDVVRKEGFMSIESLAQLFDVTAQTIRSDVNQLNGMSLLRRYHGGVGLSSSVENESYGSRQVKSLNEKRHIAATLVKHIPAKASLFINIGTTTEEVATALLNHRDLRIITNNLNVARILSANPSFEVIIAGGVVRSRDQGVTGEATIDFISQFKVDFGIIGISGIDSDGTLLDFDYREVRVAKAIIQNSRAVFMAADWTKFGRNAMVRLGHISQIDALFTDRRPDEEMCAILKEADVTLHIPDSV
jgi:DeoR family glycerol-3-phosphate regulon repressor